MILDDPDKIRVMLRRRAMDLLARREHTRHELSSKLSAVFRKSQQQAVSEESLVNPSEDPEADFNDARLLIQQMFIQVLTEVLDKLEQDKLLSDSRFTESYVHGRMGRGYGPLYIRHQLRQKQVDATLLDNNFERLDQEQWIEQLLLLTRRRVGEAGFPERGSKDYLKLQRFILSRGFTSSQWYEIEKRFKSQISKT